jgi:putative hydrolase
MTDLPDRPDLPEGFDPSAFTDTPLFRELQRVLSSSSGPVNWELARQVGIAGAQDGREDPAPSDDDRRGLEDAVRLAELQVTRFTGLESPGDVSRVRPVRRAEWVAANAEELRELLEPAAERAARTLEEVAGSIETPDETAVLGAAPMLAQLSPLLMGAQVGTVLGILGQRSMSRYDVAVPTADTGELRFVVANMQAFERDWSLEAREFRTWVALHEVAHRFAFARPWIASRFRDLLTDFLSTLTLDVEAMRAKFSSLDAADPEALQGLMDGEEGLFGAVLDDEQRIKLGRLQAFMAATEGFGDHVSHAIGEELLPSHDRIREALRRHHEGQDADPVFERLLGVEMKREHYLAGRAFCDRVAELTDEATLARMWDSAEAMPSLPEVDEPRLWLARTA